MRRLRGLGLALGALLALGLLNSAPVAAQQMLTVSIRNMSFGAVQLTVFDHVCERVVFQRRLANSATTGVRVCADRRGRGQITIYDYRGRGTRYRDVIASRTITVRVR